jgi:hypothetical protein
MDVRPDDAILPQIDEERINEHAAENARRDETAERERAIAVSEICLVAHFPVLM